MKKVILKARTKINNIDFKKLSEINDMKLNFENISKIKILLNKQIIELGKVFSIKVISTESKRNEIIINGCNKYCNFLGYEWKRDKLIVNSDVGLNVGARMISGEIYVKGSVDDFLGAEMSGGFLHVSENAKNRVGSTYIGKRQGMSGGEIIVEGQAGDYVGHFMRRGLIIINGNVGKFCCYKMIAGNVILKKKFESHLGLLMKRGSIFLLDENLKNFKSKSFKPFFFEESSFLKYFKKYLYQKYNIDLGRKKFLRLNFDRNIKGIGEIFLKMN
tara:strand:+ start:2510 stop:3331 length:822 start_codon:yes stop_codon:yes gene_type:complete